MANNYMVLRVSVIPLAEAVNKNTLLTRGLGAISMLEAEHSFTSGNSSLWCYSHRVILPNSKRLYDRLREVHTSGPNVPNPKEERERITYLEVLALNLE